MFEMSAENQGEDERVKDLELRDLHWRRGFVSPPSREKAVRLLAWQLWA